MSPTNFKRGTKMSFKRNISSLIAVAGAAMVLGSSVFAQDTTPVTPAAPKAERPFKGDREGRKGEFGGRHGRHGKRGFGMRGGMMFRDLNLTDAQKDQMKQIREANKPNKENFDAIRTLMKAKHDGTITADQEAQLKAFHDQRKAKMEQIRASMLAVLTPEQKALLEQKKQERKQRFEEFKKNRELRRQQKQSETPKVS